jgi:hypothetical protein
MSFPAAAARRFASSKSWIHSRSSAVGVRGREAVIGGAPAAGVVGLEAAAALTGAASASDAPGKGSAERSTVGGACGAVAGSVVVTAGAAFAGCTDSSERRGLEEAAGEDATGDGATGKRLGRAAATFRTGRDEAPLGERGPVKPNIDAAISTASIKSGVPATA